MNKIGRVLHISPSGKAVLKAETVPRIGDTVLDGDGRVVGKVFDVMGPVDSPYVEVDVKGKRKVVGRLLYVSPRPKRGRKRVRRGRLK
ncbi:MAG: RNA-binding protein involved in rRNA processing [Candidatus Bathyarchaeota archaeon B26-2]|nr:MAG: RNA-binding protein involved in rRNA processing [Candidatus Bathyarchaeota archaeon B26-2]